METREMVGLAKKMATKTVDERSNRLERFARGDFMSSVSVLRHALLSAQTYSRALPECQDTHDVRTDLNAMLMRLGTLEQRINQWIKPKTIG